MSNFSGILGADEIKFMRIAIKTLGCRSNRYESDRIFEELIRLGHSAYEMNEGADEFLRRYGGDVDVLIVNTCTVTHIADRKSRQAMRSFKNACPGVRIVAFGCGVNVGECDDLEEIDFLAKSREEVMEYIGGDEICSYQGREHAGLRTRALIKIQDGCNNFCSYCIIPQARGRERSFLSEEILKEAVAKEAAGFKEIVLTGINIGRWKEGAMDLADLFEKLLERTSSVRFRVSSIEPENFSSKFYALFASGRFCPHIHMSLQSGSDSVLNRMRRKYNCAEFEEICNKFRAEVPDIGLTTDVIVGFPGETDTEFAETCEFVRRVGFLKTHVFPYSVREKTAAAYMEGHVAADVKKKRAAELRAISVEVGREFMKRWIGNEYSVLAEECFDGVCKGYTMNYIPVAFEAGDDVVNKLVDVRLRELVDGRVRAQLLKS